MFLYKVMPRVYYERAIKFGDICFQATEYANTCTSVNKDENENKAKVEVHIKEEILKNLSVCYPETEFHCFKGKIAFSYCFTTDIKSYIEKNNLDLNNEVVLRFDLKDVVDFFRSLDLLCFIHGNIVYDKNYEFTTSRILNDLEVISYSFLEDYEYLSCLKTFIKSKEYKDECEYRFTCLPIATERLMYYSSKDSLLLGIFDEGRYCLSDDTTLFIKIIPLFVVGSKRVYINRNVQDLFEKAEILDITSLN